ncbi:MAG: DUF5694 domain-containing protein [Bacteroidota bacterium]|mgnify:FL=1
MDKTKNTNNLNHFIITNLCFFISFGTLAQISPNNGNKTSVSQAISELPKTVPSMHHEVMVFGTFHFDRDNDGSDVVGKYTMEVKSEENQKRLDSLIEHIAKRFQPTKVVIELRPHHQKFIDSLYEAYLSGEYVLGKNEVFQLGFRMANKLKLQKVYCIDNRPPQPETVLAIDDWEVYARQMGHESLWHEYDATNNAHNTYMDNLKIQMGLLEYLKLVNSQALSERNKQFWVTGLVNLGVGDSYIGADLTGNWFRRNTRIFANTRHICETNNERVFMVYGYGHKWILEELFKASPEFTVKPAF